MSVPLKIKKALFATLHPACWSALGKRVVPAIEHRAVLRSMNSDLLLDVGANRGQFSLVARMEHPHWSIHAFEPQPSEAAIFRQIFRKDALVKLHELALGEEPGEADIHISRRRDSSSLLPIGEMQAKLFPSTEEVGTRRVQVVTLDSQRFHWPQATRILLKIDVQGFELSVLRGAVETLLQCAYVYAECSQIPLYTGQALYPEVDAFLVQHDFRVVNQFNEQFDRGRLIQADYLFARAS